MEILGIDAGNFETKVANSRGVFSFNSAMLDGYDINTISQKYGDDDMLWEYDTERGIAGTVAEYEGSFGDNRLYGDSKNHFQAQMRILLAIHKYSQSNDVKIVVGQPFKKHLSEKEDIILSLKRKHPPLTVNGVTKVLNIQEVNVSIEGAAAYYSAFIKETIVRVIDIGSGTVNCITFKNGIMVKDQSDTLPFGTETSLTEDTKDLPGIVRGIYRSMSKVWNKNDIVYVCGGIAKDSIVHFKQYYPRAEILKSIMSINKYSEIVSPKYANAVGMYRIAESIYLS